MPTSHKPSQILATITKLTDLIRKQLGLPKG